MRDHIKVIIVIGHLYTIVILKTISWFILERNYINAVNVINLSHRLLVLNDILRYMLRQHHASVASVEKLLYKYQYSVHIYLGKTI